jgi:hypothetical protein
VKHQADDDETTCFVAAPKHLGNSFATCLKSNHGCPSDPSGTDSAGLEMSLLVISDPGAADSVTRPGTSPRIVALTSVDSFVVALSQLVPCQGPRPTFLDFHRRNLLKRCARSLFSASSSSPFSARNFGGQGLNLIVPVPKACGKSTF